MRWLIGHPGPAFSVADLYEGWTEALRGLGEDVFTFNLDRRLQFYDAACIADEEEPGYAGMRTFRKAMTREKAIDTAAYGILSTAYQCWPHVILLISAFFTPPQLLDIMHSRGHRIVLLHTESPYQDDEQLVRAAHADLNLLNDPANLDRYRELGPAEYMPHAYRESVHYPGAPGATRKWDLSFIGTGYPSRVRFFEGLDLDGLDVHLAGPWLGLPEDSPLRDWTLTDDEACVDNDETAQIYRDSRCGINLYRREGEAAHQGEGVACGPREIEMAACGLWFTRDPRPESDALFPMLPAFTSPAEASEQIRWALARPEARDKAAAQAREAVADRTFGNHARKLLAILDR
ncbi:MAG TPA: glycosyltransferase [Streptosporangiaceae bacterium]|nr:glycosyltransferase [Streptosporangiaceae bacterium]